MKPHPKKKVKVILLEIGTKKTTKNSNNDQKLQEKTFWDQNQKKKISYTEGPKVYMMYY